MIKSFVIDTSVILFDPMSIFKFKDNNVYIPLVVIEELDKFKKFQNENGRNARHFSRILDELRKKGPLATGVQLDGGGKLLINVSAKFRDSFADIIDLKLNDNKILLHAIDLKEKDPDRQVILVTKDMNLRVKADALGIKGEDFGREHTTIDEMYTGQRLYSVSLENLKLFEKDRLLPVEDDSEGFHANEYVIVHEENNPSHRLLGRYVKKKKGIVPLIRVREGVWGIYPRNTEQQFAFDALLNNEVKLVSLTGKAGTGKTLLAIAAGLEMTISKQDYQRVLVSRPIQPMGRDLGFLPGDVNEKLGPWMQPIFDNIDYLFGTHKAGGHNSWEELITQGLLHVEPLTYIRGRSIPEQYLIVDEAQNLSPHEIKTIITRAGDGTKIILTGDIEQIDNPYLDSVSNGLAVCVERFKEEDIMGHVTLKVGERSELSEIASKLL